MNYRSGVLTGIAATLLLAGAAVAGWWLLVGKSANTSKAAPPVVPAIVPKPFKEEQSTGITLTSEAESRLSVRTGTVERKPIGRVRVYGAEVTVPPGRSVVVAAPLAGLLKPVEGVVPVAGLDVKKGQPILQLLPILDPVGRANLTTSKVDTEGQVKNAEEQLRAAQIALDRAKKVLAGGAGSQRMVDEAQAQVDLATKTLEAATARRELLNKVVGQVESGTTTPIPIEAPENGVLRSVSALPGQTVPSAAALFEVMNLDRVWVRVPVYVGDLPDLDTAGQAAVGNLTVRPGEATRAASPVSAPPMANPTAGTTDLFYMLDNRESRYSPGQRVGATLPLRGPANGLTVPWSAVVYDIHGGAWVYEKTGERHYNRRRVIVQYVINATAVLASGPPPGTTVVIAGAAELFGTEVGFSK